MNGVMHLISSLQVGGAEKLLVSFLEEARHQSSMAFVVVVMNNQVHEDLKRELLALGLPVYFLNRPEGHKHPKYLRRLKEIIAKHNISLIHAHNAGSKFWAMLCKATQPSLKLAFTVHDTHIVPKMKPWERSLHQRFIDHTIAISDAVFRECDLAGIRPASRIYNGIRVARFAEHRHHREQLSPPIRIINVARMDHRKKGQDILLRALDRCKRQGMAFQCKLVGGVYAYNQRAYQELRDLARELNLQEQVEFLTDRTDIPNLLGSSDLFVLPSRYEGLGLVVLEAMAAGVPVIASAMDGPRELIVNEETGLLVEPENYEALAETMVQVLSNPARLQQMREAAFRFVQGMDISVMTEQYLQLYRRLLGLPDGENRSKQEVCDGSPV